MSPRDIELHINELVLHGFEKKDRFRIGEAMKQELIRLFTEQAASPSLARCGDIACLNGGEIKVEQGSRPEMVGMQVARALYGGFQR